jgi:hypothetical protein
LAGNTHAAKRERSPAMASWTDTQITTKRGRDDVATNKPEDLVEAVQDAKWQPVYDPVS